MPITRTPIIDDDGSGTTGTVIDNAWKTEFYNQIDGALPVAAPAVDVPFDPANYFISQGAGTWTPTAASQTVLQYVRVSATLSIVSFQLSDAGQTMTGTPSGLGIVIPGLPVCRKLLTVSFHYFGPVQGTGICQVATGGSYLSLLRDIGGTAWTTGAYWLMGTIPVIH